MLEGWCYQQDSGQVLPRRLILPFKLSIYHTIFFPFIKTIYNIIEWKKKKKRYEVISNKTKLQSNSNNRKKFPLLQKTFFFMSPLHPSYPHAQII